MVGTLEQRARTLQIEDVDWYLEAYARAARRLETEEKRTHGKNIERLQRNLQALFDKIVEGLELDKPAQDRRRATALAINGAITDYGHPRTVRILFPIGEETA